jgi:hypothetical protein
VSFWGGCRGRGAADAEIRESSENNLDFFGPVEKFLTKHLGGRAEPWREISGSTAEL